jgi:hypothetical protein
MPGRSYSLKLVERAHGTLWTGGGASRVVLARRGGVSSQPPPRPVCGATGAGEAPSQKRRATSAPPRRFGGAPEGEERFCALRCATPRREPTTADNDPRPLRRRREQRRCTQPTRRIGEGASLTPVAPTTGHGGGFDETPPTPRQDHLYKTPRPHAIALALVRAAVLGGLCVALCGASSPPSLEVHRAPVMAAVTGMVVGGSRAGGSILRRIAGVRGVGGGLVDALEPGARVSMEDAFKGSTNPMPRRERR